MKPLFVHANSLLQTYAIAEEFIYSMNHSGSIKDLSCNENCFIIKTLRKYRF